jgi:hypothetical protein
MAASRNPRMTRAFKADQMRIGFVRTREIRNATNISPKAAYPI